MYTIVYETYLNIERQRQYEEIVNESIKDAFTSIGNAISKGWEKFIEWLGKICKWIRDTWQWIKNKWKNRKKKKDNTSSEDVINNPTEYTPEEVKEAIYEELRFSLSDKKQERLNKIDKRKERESKFGTDEVIYQEGEENPIPALPDKRADRIRKIEARKEEESRYGNHRTINQGSIEMQKRQLYKDVESSIKTCEKNAEQYLRTIVRLIEFISPEVKSLNEVIPEIENLVNKINTGNKYEASQAELDLLNEFKFAANWHDDWLESIGKIRDARKKLDRYANAYYVSYMNYNLADKISYIESCVDEVQEVYNKVKSITVNAENKSIKMVMKYISNIMRGIQNVLYYISEISRKTTESNNRINAENTAYFHNMGED